MLTEHGDTVDSDRLSAIERELTGVVASGVAGEVVELGCFRGAMAVWMRAILDQLGDHGRAIHVYDSFQGLPAPGPQDSDYLAEGEIAATADEVLDLHQRWGLKPPTIHAGWFDDTLPTELPEQIAFGYLDGDFYDSIMTSLTHCVPRLAMGAVIVVDDYADTVVNPQAWDGLPGVKRACDDYFGAPSPLEVLFGEGDLAFGVLRRGA
jgi:O-methyltransferase